MRLFRVTDKVRVDGKLDVPYISDHKDNSMKNSTKSTREGSSRGEHTGSRLLQSSVRLWLTLCMCMEAFEWKQEAAESVRLQKRRSPKKIQQLCEQLLLPDKS